MIPATMNTQVTDIDLLRKQVAEAKVQDTVQSNAAFLKFDFRSGDWLVGRDEIVATDMKAVINVASFHHGWVLWDDGQAEKKLAPFTREIPERIPDRNGNSASEARAVAGKFPEDRDDELAGLDFIFETNSFGGRQGVDNLWGAIRNRAATGTDYFFPVVRLTATSYRHKTHKGIVHNPVFEVVDWVDVNGDTERKQLPPKTEEAPATRARRRG